MNMNMDEKKQFIIVADCLLKVLFLALLTIIGGSVQAKQIFVATNGDDSNEGTMASPFWSVQRAQTAANPEIRFICGGAHMQSMKAIFHR